MSRKLKARTHTMASLAVASLLLSGCAAAVGSTNPVESAAATAPAPQSEARAPAGAAATHARDQHAAAQTAGPSEASKMICAQEAKEDISSILALQQAPHTVDNWSDSTYSCTYHLAGGPLVISVKESPDPAVTRKHFDALQVKLNAEPIKGLANLGFPAAQTADGSVVFLKDNSTLHVNATGLPAAVGPQKVSRTDFAYQVATTILACWKEHH
ncbi:hypothetical protein [Arthrobacter globiformis]|uniref:hypothetical protein n=1 Tax=Arthrobacter globiformis TaxID=1665 RepID=UPI00279323D8|nr:hypothetical protein [Arthrobacter globiformis]MDQ0620026.1 uncharacterized protein YceK [Arthrobacter globiformis]